MSKRYLWVVERKDGDEWVPTSWVSMPKSTATQLLCKVEKTFPYNEYRVVKYTPAE